MMANTAEEPRLTASEDDRIQALDLIRGAALLGVIWMDLEGHLRGPFARFLLDPHPWPGFLNHVADIGIIASLMWKAMSLYAFLFGVGLAIQCERRRESPRAFRRFALRRMAALLVIGSLHVTFVFEGDILIAYAFCGMLTALLYARLQPRSLALLGCGWIVATLALVVWMSSGSVMPSPEDLADGARNQIQDALVDNLHTGWWASIGLRWSHVCERYIGYLFQGVLYAQGLMLLGLAAWKAGVFTDLTRWRNRARFIARTVLPAAFLLALLIWLIPDLQGRRFMFQPLWASALQFASTPVLALGYAAGLWCVAHHPRWRTRLAPVAAIGRMGLTNYLLHSLVLTWIFYGYGLSLFDHFGSFVGTVLIGLALFTLMACWSRWWLKRFTLGPAEWLWRCMTYGTLQPFRLRTAHLAPLGSPWKPTSHRVL
jgi:uncharacterized protein